MRAPAITFVLLALAGRGKVTRGAWHALAIEARGSVTHFDALAATPVR